MDRQFVTLCFIFVLYSLAATSVRSDELVVLNWEEYLSPSVITKFKAETGVQVKVVTYDSDSKRDEILASPAARQFDMVVIDNYSIAIFGKTDLLLKLPPRQLSNLDHIGDRWKNSCGEHGVPYYWGTLGIAYHKDRVSAVPESWNDLIYPKSEHRGHIGMILDSIDTLAPVLKLAGHSINSTDQQALKSTYDTLMRQRPWVLTYDHAVGFLKTPKGAELHMALVFGGNQYSMNDGGDTPWKYVIPKEGTVLWVDCMSILSSSDKQTQALQFLDFLNRPDIAALNAEEVGSATPNAAAYKRLPPEMRNDPVLYPDEELLNNSENYKLLNPDNMRVRERIIEALQHHETE